MPERYTIREESDLFGNQRLVVKRELTAADIGKAIGKTIDLVVSLDRNVRWEAANNLIDKGSHHLSDGDFELAVAISTVLIANRDPQVHYSGRLLRAHALRRLELYGDAIEDYDVSLAFARDQNLDREMLQDYADTFILRGLCYYELELFDAAARDFLKTAEISPSRPAAWFYLGRVCDKSKQHDQAIKYLIHAEQLDKRNKYLEDLLELRAWNYAILRQRTAARADFDRLLQVVAGRKTSRGYRELGKFYLFENDPKSALVCLDTAVTLVPRYSGNLEARADAHEQLGHPIEAARDRAEASILKRIEEAYKAYFTLARQMWCNGHRQWFTEADTYPPKGFASIWKVDQSKQAKALLTFMQSQDQKMPMYSIFFQRYLNAKQAGRLADFESEVYPILRKALVG